MKPCGSQERTRKRLHVAPPALECVDTQFLHRPANLRGRGGRRQWFAKCDAYGIGDAARPFPEKASTGKTEDRAPDAVQVHRNDGDVDAFHDAFKPTTERQHLADARNLAFRENAHDFTVAQRFGGSAQRVNHFARALIRSDGNDLQHFGEWFDQRILVDAPEHQEPDWPVGCGNQKNRIYP